MLQNNTPVLHQSQDVTFLLYYYLYFVFFWKDMDSILRISLLMYANTQIMYIITLLSYSCSWTHNEHSYRVNYRYFFVFLRELIIFILLYMIKLNESDLFCYLLEMKKIVVHSSKLFLFPKTVVAKLKFSILETKSHACTKSPRDSLLNCFENIAIHS